MASDGPAFDSACRQCARLAAFLDDVRQKHPNYHCAPVAPFGSRRHTLLVVGLAPGMHGANATGRPFTGDHAGILLYKTLHAHGFSNQSTSERPGDGLKLANCRITNAVKCLPPENKPTTGEVAICNPYLKGDLAEVARPGVVVALGRIAHNAVIKALGFKQSALVFAHGAEHDLGDGLTLVDSYHCSRYNTQTKRLTPSMFDRIFQRARTLIDR